MSPAAAPVSAPANGSMFSSMVSSLSHHQPHLSHHHSHSYSHPQQQQQPPPARYSLQQHAPVGCHAPALDFPLRMLVNSEMVGAIIGRHGSTIRQITQSTRARVDIHRKESSASNDKAITIYGNADNCDNACRKIMEVMRDEADNTNKGDIPLRLLAHNNLISRIIGKGGHVIKGIMDETQSKIAINSITEVNSYNVERIITISADDLESVTEAAKRVAAKLRHSYQSDLQRSPQSMMYAANGSLSVAPSMALAYGGGTGHGSMPPAAPLSGPPAQRSAGAGLYGAPPSLLAGGGAALYPGGVSRGVVPYLASGAASAPETCHLYVPASSVGALIGRKGANIRTIIRYSGASVRIGQHEESSSAAIYGSELSPHPAPVDTPHQNHSGDNPQPSAPGLADDLEQHEQKEGESRLAAGVPAAAAPARRPALLNKPLSPAIQPQRKVTILGTAEAQWKAQFLLFDKLREEGYGSCLEDVRLPLEISVPSGYVGRIVGKRGVNVRQLQRSSGAQVRLPQPTVDQLKRPHTQLQLVGSFYSVQTALRRIRLLVAQSGGALASASTPPEHHLQQQDHEPQQQQQQHEEEEPQPQQLGQQQESAGDGPVERLSTPDQTPSVSV